MVASLPVTTSAKYCASVVAGSVLRLQPVHCMTANAATTIAALSNGVGLPTGTINVASTSGFPTAHTLSVQTNLGLQGVTYTGKTATTFTGCAGGAGSMATGGKVLIQSSMSAHVPEWVPDYGPTTQAPVLKGVAYLILKMKYEGSRYRNSVPQVSALIRGKKIYDPRTAVAITSSSVANPTHLTTGSAHGRSPGDLVRVIGHTGSTPSINGVYRCQTGTSGTTIVLPINVSVGGSGGTVGMVGYSANPALCQRDYLASARYGRGAPDALVYDANVASGVAAEATNAGDGPDNLVGAATSQPQWVPADLVTFPVVTVNTSTEKVNVVLHGYTAGQDVYFIGTVTTPSILGRQRIIATGLDANNFELDAGVQAGGAPSGVAVDFTVGGAQPAGASVTAARPQETFRCDGMVDTSRSLRQNMSLLLTASRADCFYQAGQYRLFTRRVTSPSAIVIGPDQMVGDVRTVMPGAGKAPNVLRVTFLDGANNWVPTPFFYPPIDSTNPFLAQDANFKVERPLELPFTNDRHMAEQLAMVLLKETRNGRQVSVSAKEVALGLGVSDVAPVTYDTAGWSSKAFWVRRLRILQEGIVGLQLLEYAASAYTYDLVPSAPKLIDTALPSPLKAPYPPTNLVLTTGTSDPRIFVQWTGSMDARADHYEIWARRTVCLDPTVPIDADWRHLASVDARTPYCYIGPVLNLDQWSVRVRAVSEIGVPSDADADAWVCAATCVVQLIKPAKLGTIIVTADGSSVSYQVPFGAGCDHVFVYSSAISTNAQNNPPMNQAALVEVLRPIPKTLPVSVGWTYSTVGSGGAIHYSGIATDGVGVWVRVGNSQSPERSVDGGQSWTAYALPTPGASVPTCVAWGNGQFVVVSTAGRVWTSPDAKTWAYQGQPLGTGDLNGVCYGLGVWVAVGAAGVLGSSPDAITWTGRTSQFGATYILAVACSGAAFVAVGGSGKLSSSPDGFAWTAQTSTFGAVDITAVAFGNGTWLIVGNQANYATSPTGATWTSRTGAAPGGFFTNAALYSNGLFMAFWSNGATSPDAITWTPITTGFGSTIYAGAGLAGKVIVVGQGYTSGFTGPAWAISTPTIAPVAPLLKISTTANWYRTTTFLAYTVDGSIGDIVTVGPTQAVASGGGPSAAPTTLAFVSATPTSITFSWSNNGDTTSVNRVWVDGVIYDGSVAAGLTGYTVSFGKNVPVGAHLIAVDHWLNGQASTQAGPTSMSTTGAGSGPGSFTASLSTFEDGRGRDWDIWAFAWTDIGPWEIWMAAVPVGAVAPSGPQFQYATGSSYVSGTVGFSALVGTVSPRDYYFWIRGTTPQTAFTALTSNPLEAT